VLWDVDNTLISAGGAGLRLYEAAFRDMYGLELPRRAPRRFAGRTDTAIALELLGLAGVPDPDGQLERFQAFLASRAGTMADDLREQGRALPGAAETIAALAAGLNGQPVLQSLLTGNLPEFAQIKLSTLNLAEHLDLTIGAYGNISADRADLVEVARARAVARHGGDFGGRLTVLVGDTPDDVDAALRNGASIVAVASGDYSAADLSAAGAHAVLPDLADTAASVTAILGAPAAGPESG
jgi:phosphoglycolate phosphatase